MRGRALLVGDGSVSNTLAPLEDDLSYQRLKKNLQRAGEDGLGQFTKYIKEKRLKDESELLTPDEVGARLKITTQTVKDWLREGKIKGFKMGRLWRIKEEDLEAFIAETQAQQGKKD